MVHTCHIVVILSSCLYAPRTAGLQGGSQANHLLRAKRVGATATAETTTTTVTASATGCEFHKQSTIRPSAFREPSHLNSRSIAFIQAAISTRVWRIPARQTDAAGLNAVIEQASRIRHARKEPEKNSTKNCDHHNVRPSCGSAIDKIDNQPAGQGHQRNERLCIAIGTRAPNNSAYGKAL